MAQATTQEAHYLADFAEREEADATSAPEWLRLLRRNAITAFERTGFPTARRGNELWKYTDVRSLAAAAFDLPAHPEIDGDATAGLDLHPYDLPCPRVHQLVFVDGHYAADLSTEPPAEAGLHSDVIGRREQGLIVGRLAEGITELPQVREHLSRHALAEGNAFAALNTAFAQDGAIVYIPDDVFVPEPIYLLFVSTGRGGPSVTHPRVLIVAGARSRATVLQSFESVGEEPAPGEAPAPYFTNVVTEVVTHQEAALRLYRLQREGSAAYHVATTHALVGRDSTLSSVTMDIGGSLVRHDQTIDLSEPGAAVTLNGLYLGKGTRHIDNHTLIDHSAPETSSNEVYKGILANASHGVFVGQVLVRKDSQHVDAHQINKNLLLSDSAKVDTQPKLEIFADDVKCTHGAAVGRLDRDALFYLNSRGLDEREARELLVHGFVNEVIEAIEDDAVRQYADAAIVAQLS